MVSNSRKSGFTIIEVVLVLAIAGLIFLMVFIALPMFQRTQRDRQRDNNIAEIVAAMQNYRSKNSRKLPGTVRGGRYDGEPCFLYSTNNCETLKPLNDFLDRYVTEDVVDPSSGDRYRFVAAGISGSSCREQYNKIDTNGNLFNHYGYAGIIICYQTKCDGSFTNSKTLNSASIYYHREAGGVVCKDV